MRSRPVSRGQPRPSLQPCIAELVRTCVYPPNLILRVEKILEEVDEEARLALETSSNPDGSRTAYRLYLGDGEIMIQAVLAPHLHPLIDLHETIEGSLIELRDYSIRKAARRSGKGEVIFLAVQDYVCITLSRPTTSEVLEDALVNGGGLMVEEDTANTEQRLSTYIQVPSSPVEEMAHEVQSSQESCAYETIQVDSETLRKRRQALHEMSSNARSKRRRHEAEDETPVKRPRPNITHSASSHGTDLSKTIKVDPETLNRRRLALHALCNDTNLQEKPTGIATTRSKHFTHESDVKKIAHSEAPESASANETAPPTTNPLPSAPIHTLLSLLHPPTPFPRNYPITVLAAISWISPTTIQPRGSLFPPSGP